MMRGALGSYVVFANVYAYFLLEHIHMPWSLIGSEISLYVGTTEHQTHK